MSSVQLAPGTAIETFTVSGIARSRVGATTYDATDASGAAAQVTVYDGACFPSALVLERSLRELRQLQTVAHPRVARVLGCGKLAGGGTWEAHAPLPPQSLAEHLAAGALAEADAIAIASQIGEALIEAQKVGVIHRSLGADVVFPSPNGVVVAGFAVGAPQGGKSFGPLDTIAPEQVEGKVVDQRTLIYNLAALLHGMLRGAPLFVGDSAAILQAHLTQEPGAEVAPALRRGLAKDPRVRPMMLRQFVIEITQGVGAATTDSGAPTSRGWTMFTSDSPPPPAAAAAAAAPAATAAPAPASPPPPMADAAQPSTRGWTMFMQAAAGDDAVPVSEPGTASAATPAPVATPTPAAVAPAVPAEGGKPSTRGWTMFMQAADDPAPASEAAVPSSNVVVTANAAAAPVAAATPSATPSATAPAAPPVAATAPSSRGWTMFTNAADAEEQAPTAAASPALAAPIDATVVAPAPTTGDPAKPSTRGWTMFTRDDEPPSPAAAAAASAFAATPVEPVPDDGADGGGPPSSRGWTMFMEPGAAAAAAGAASAPSASSAASAASSTPTPAVMPASEAEAPAGGQRRGWTMFMEAPIASAPQAQFGPTGAAPSPEPTPEPTPAVDTSSSDNRGWTVFGAPAPGAAAPDTATAEGRTVVVTPTPVAHDASEGPTASGQVTSSEAPEPAPGRGRTVVAAGVTALPGSVGGVTGRTVFPSAQPAMPDTQYFRRGDIPPERPTSRTTAVDVHAPAGRPPVEERDASPRAPVPALGESNMPERTGGSKTAILVVVGVGVIGTIVALVAWLT